MEFKELENYVLRFPRKSVGFYPTPFHKVGNISDKYNVNIFMKREDMAGPGTISGSKIRLAEFIVGSAIENGVTHILTVGAYLSNSAMQVAAAAIQAGIKPIVFLYDTMAEGLPKAYRGNLLLDQLMGVEVVYIPRAADESQEGIWDAKIFPAVETRKAELEAQGHKVMVAPAGAAHPVSFMAHTLTYKEMIEQARKLGVELDYIYHTTGTGSTLPGMIAAKLLTGNAGGSVKIRSIAINSYRPENWVNREMIVERVKVIFQQFGQQVPADDVIRAEIDVDERFIGRDYAVPSEEGTAAIKELASCDAVFLGPVYTAKGFAGLLAHIREGRVPAGSNIAFLHTGDTGNLFEDPRIVGEVTELHRNAGSQPA
jgi:1-aminocyclopropane-1-carboxylate deaminase/D-cysteine desulfhydrase-like pyridoxal-dependent ACC family enzyme